MMKIFHLTHRIIQYIFTKASRLLIINECCGETEHQIGLVDLYNSSFHCDLTSLSIPSDNIVGSFTKSGPVVCGDKEGSWAKKQCFALNISRQFEEMFDRNPWINEVCGNIRSYFKYY